MNKKFSGKTLLMLGSNVGAKEMVMYAKKNGAYTIVADYYGVDKSNAKQVADEAVLISTNDLGALSQLVVNKKVDGVLSGVSEFNIMNALKLSEMHKLPFYCNLQQWETIEHKEQFRLLCEKVGVPCPSTYFVGTCLNEEDLGKIKYPAVLKPVDCATSKGVHICLNQNELEEHFNESLTCSSAGLVIVEEFVEGDEFTAHYTISNGNPTFSCIDNRYPVSIHEGRVTTIPVARVYPSVFIDSYIRKVNTAMIKLCNDLKLKNGILFVQGIHNKQTDKFWIFEAGLRSAGEAPNRFLSKLNGIDYMNVLVDNALLGKSKIDQTLEDPYMKGKCCGIISFVARHGKVSKIDGLDEAVRNVKSVIDYECRYHVGDITPDTDTLRQLMIRFVMICDSREQMKKDVEYLNKHITVLDQNGKNMVVRFEPERLSAEF